VPAILGILVFSRVACISLHKRLDLRLGLVL
jgi:hypothetical protein